MAPTLAGATLPYLALQLAGVSATTCVEHRAQILQIEQQQALLVGDLEDDIENAFLRVVEIEQARQAAAAPSPTMVARTGWPCSPNTSQKTTGKRSGCIGDADLLGAFDEGRLALRPAARGRRDRP